mgnify:CR=1 FL=1
MTDEDKARFLALVPDRPDVVVKPMFGNLGAYVNGNMFMGSFGADVGVKLSAEDRDALLAIEGAAPILGARLTITIEYLARDPLAA